MGWGGGPCSERDSQSLLFPQKGSDGGNQPALQCGRHPVCAMRSGRPSVLRAGGEGEAGMGLGTLLNQKRSIH